MAIAVAGVGYRFFMRAPALTSKDTILLADFVNTTGEAVFDFDVLHMKKGGRITSTHVEPK